MSQTTIEKLRKYAVRYAWILVLLVIFFTHWLQKRAEEESPGLAGSTRASFVESAAASCNKDPVNLPDFNLAKYCGYYANALADSLSIKEIKAITAVDSREATLTAIQPKEEAAAKHCLPDPN